MKLPRVAGWQIAVAAAAVVLLVVAGVGAGYLQASYPGGFLQAARDVGGPARLSSGQVESAIRPSLVSTIAETWHNPTLSQGSAFFYTGSDVVVTAAHQLPWPVVNLAVVDRAGAKHSADLLTRDASDDIAVLRVKDLSGVPLKPAVHPLYPRSRIYMVGNGTASAAARVLSGEVKSLDFSTTLDGVVVDHAVLVTGGPVDSSMTGGPVVDEWGRVVGVLRSTVPNGKDVVVVPLKTLLAYALAAKVNTLPMYVGPPLIKTSASKLVLAPDYFAKRNAKQNANETSYMLGSFSASFSQGDIWVGTFGTIAGAVSAVGQCALGKGWGSIVKSTYAIGDGGEMISARGPYGDYTFQLCWSERNAEAIWWVQARGYNEATFFTNTATAQEKVLYDAT
jgi:hypothetical protein